ncbi:MAG: hypothetical protein K8U57_27300 [Planctomycetes bacterium]|nr:hypothetical protein [Planctomycetota bacterium]
MQSIQEFVGFCILLMCVAVWAMGRFAKQHPEASTSLVKTIFTKLFK